MQVNLINHKKTPKITFNGCNISKLNKDIIRQHVEFDSLMKETYLSNAAVENKTNAIWEQVLKIYENYKDNKKLKVEVSSYKGLWGEEFEGFIQAKVGIEDSEFFEKVVSSVSDFDLDSKISNETKGYSYLFKDV